VMARACPDMRFGMVQTISCFLQGGGVTPLNACWELQGNGDGAIGDAPLDAQEFALVGDGDNVESYPVDAVLWGEQFLSVRALAQRFSRVADVTVATMSVNFTLPHFFPPPHTFATNVIPNGNHLGLHPPWTWFAHYASMFVGVRGSTRYKFLTENISSGLTSSAAIQGYEYAEVVAAPSFGGATSSAVLAYPAASENVRAIADTGQWEVTLPYYDSQKFWPYRWVGGLVNAFKQRQDTFSMLSLGANVKCFVAGGPDSAFIRFRRTPGLIARAADT